MKTSNDHDRALRILQEVEKRRALSARLDYDKLLFGKQRDFVQSPSKTKAACCSRRAGKSTSLAVYALREGTKHDMCLIPYITLTKQQAYNIMWLALQVLDKRLSLGLDFNRNRLEVTLPNGSRIQLYGSDDRAEIERLRGPSYPLVLIDECQSFRPYLEEMIQDILEPATLDYDGTIVMTGTPGPTPTGYFHEATNTLNSGWDVHHWTLMDNPYLPNAQEWLEKRMAKYGWTEETPRVLREYRGLWVPDSDSLVYHFQSGRNTTEWDEHEDRWTYVLGLDLGYTDTRKQTETSGSTAFAVLAYSEHTHRVVLIESSTASQLIPSAVAARVERLQERYPFEAIVADAGGFGKGYVEEMRQRYQLPVIPAEKSQKAAYIEYLNGDLRSGVLKIVPESNEDLLHEMGLLQWNEDRTAPDKDKYNDHLCDALLYGWRYCRQYLHEPEREGPTAGTRQWYDDKMRIEEEREMERFQSMHGKAWWESEDSSLPRWLED